MLMDPDCNREIVNAANHKFGKEFFQRIFNWNLTQQASMQNIIRNKVHDFLKLRNSRGLPVRWCYVPTLPTYHGGAGTCLAMDFGCSDHYIKLSLCCVAQRGSSLNLVDERAFVLTPSLRRAPMSKFSDFVALCIKQMLVDNGVACTSGSATVYMGVAAGFDVWVEAQRQPASATVQTASKGYQMPGFEAFKRINLTVEIVTVINDAVGTLLSGVYQAFLSGNSADCSIGVLCHRIGANLAYLETDQDFLEVCSLDNRLLLRRPTGDGHCVVVNSEAGFFIGQNKELDDLANVFDNSVMNELKAVLRLECIISGAWFAHLLERCIRILINTSAIDAWSIAGENWTLNQAKGFEVFTLFDALHVEKSPPNELAANLGRLLDLQNLSRADVSRIAVICKAIVGRNARAIANSIIAIAQCSYGVTFPKSMAISYGGNLFASLLQLKDLLQSELNKLKPDGTEISLLHSNASLGCAVTALSAGLAASKKIEF
uniref:Phosphotransferase n=1 Tax=Macrostomum lignano TaxID=282301 RepID=A0A1I8H944_9PLAT